jgi:two-component system response regulator FixJ
MDQQAIVYIIDPDDNDRNIVRETATALQAACQSFGSAEEFLEDYSEDLPGCVVSELRLLGMNGLDLQARMAQWNIRLPVIFLTRCAETHLTVAAMRSGALTVLDKPAGRQELWDAVYTALTLDRERRLEDNLHDDVQNRLKELTFKEQMVLELMLEGLPNKTIARRLDISIRTVETRRSLIFKKTHTRSVAELVRLTLQAEPGEEPGSKRRAVHLTRSSDPDDTPDRKSPRGGLLHSAIRRLDGGRTAASTPRATATPATVPYAARGRETRT